MGLRAIILGCGSSGGVPRIGGIDGKGNWGKCDPCEPKNRRGRCSLLVQKSSSKGMTNVLIDVNADVREQLLREQIGHIDAVLFTHEHADHVHGMDDLRVIAIETGKTVPVYLGRHAAEIIVSRFSYCFKRPQNSIYPSILDYNLIDEERVIKISGVGGDIEFTAIPVQHGNIMALGYRCDRLAYTPDLSDIADGSIGLLENLDYWIIDALRYSEHIAHFNVSKAVFWLERMRVKRGILTNMHIDLDYSALLDLLPSHIVPAHDGMRVDLDGIVI